MIDFADAFEALTGYEPLAWQGRLYKGWFSKGRVPSACTLPTGLGKTSVVPIWLIALARSASEREEVQQLPRRLVYIVNRRTVVDQATDVVVRMRERLLSPDDGRWLAHATALRWLADTLRQLAEIAGDGMPLAVSTLRGELADNAEWKANPARPAIIIGTIDMIGSKLLFSGYGDGRYGRAHHAGLIGQDALIVHDEAHLTPAFSALLKAVEAEQGREQTRNGDSPRLARPIKVMELSATTRSDGSVTDSAAGGVFGVEPEDANDSVVQARLSAQKRLSLTAADAGKKDGLTGRILEAALKYREQRCRVLIYARKPEVASKIVEELRKEFGKGEQGRVGLLTGTIRGYERDRLAESELFKAFRADPQRPPQVEQTLYLVSTSAGEVGVDLDADHLVCDLTTLDSMIQRFGRVNRLGVDSGGQRRVAEVSVAVEPVEVPLRKQVPKPDIPHDLREKIFFVEGEGDKAPKLVFARGLTRALAEEAKKLWGDGNDGAKKAKEAIDGLLNKRTALDEAVAKTGEILWDIFDAGGDVSPSAVGKMFDGLSAEDKRAAFSPEPTTLRATDILFDAWSLTSVVGEMPGRPPVAEYLHGLTADPPETFVAWRGEVRLLADAQVDAEALAEWFEACPILSHERLRDRTDRVRAALDKLLTNCRKRSESADFDADVVLLNERGEARLMRLSELTNKPSDRDPLAYATVVLPVEVGGLNESGMLDPDPKAKPSKNPDVAEETPGRVTGGGHPRRRERWLVVRDADGERWKHLLSGQEARQPPSHLRERGRVTLKEPPEGDEDEGETQELVLLSERAEVGVDSPEHARFTETLDCHSERVADHARRIASALRLREELCEAVVLAAAWHDRGKDRPVWQRYARNRNSSAPLAKSNRYGHWRELNGYRHEFGSLLEAAADLKIRDHPERDLILHLIAAHHGWARPHFEPQARDNEGPRDPTAGGRRRPTTRENEEAAVEAMQRFGRLQQRFGRWGLAWLESLLRCADALASQAPGQAVASASGDGTPAACVRGSAQSAAGTQEERA